MITHYAHLTLRTLSPIGVRQVYGEAMGFPLLEETADRVAFRITPSKTFRFDRTEETVSPAHLAFEVRHSTFESSSRLIEGAGLAVSEVR